MTAEVLIRPGLRITMSDPVVVAHSPPGETRWGHFQFPAISQLPDGRCLVTFNATADSAESYGHPGPCHVSSDEGQNWAPFAASDPLLAISHSTISPLPSGDFLIVPMSPALDIRKDIKLPAAFAQMKVYGTVDYFRLDECPPAVRTYMGTIPALRWSAQQKKWKRELIQWDVAGALARVRRGEWALVRSHIDNSIVSVGDRLFTVQNRTQYLLEDGNAPKNYASYCMASDDGGRNWQRFGTIAYDPSGRLMMGEPCLAPTSDGRLLCLVRCANQAQHPALITSSSDGGRTWRPTREFHPFGVMPQVKLLGNGALVASFGRPGVHLRFCADGRGDDWSDAITLIDGDAGDRSGMKATCGYTRMLPIAKDAFLIAYSDFHHRTADGQTCKAILVRRVEARHEKAQPFVK